MANDPDGSAGLSCASFERGGSQWAAIQQALSLAEIRYWRTL